MILVTGATRTRLGEAAECANATIISMYVTHEVVTPTQEPVRSASTMLLVPIVRDAQTGTLVMLFVARIAEVRILNRRNGKCS